MPRITSKVYIHLPDGKDMTKASQLAICVQCVSVANVVLFWCKQTCLGLVSLPTLQLGILMTSIAKENPAKRSILCSHTLFA